MEMFDHKHQAQWWRGDALGLFYSHRTWTPFNHLRAVVESEESCTKQMAVNLVELRQNCKEERTRIP